MRALITGITGFVGSHLAEYLLSQGAEVWGFSSDTEIIKNIKEIKDKTTLVYDININSDALRDVIEKAEPDYIFHLVAERSTEASFLFPRDMFSTNLDGTVNLLEFINDLNIHPTIMISGCGEEYGCPTLLPREDYKIPPSWKKIASPSMRIFKLPIDEETPLNPISIYGVSNAAQDMLGYAYHKEYGMKIVRTRAFDITGPRDESSVASDIARQIVEVERGKAMEIKVGRRDIQKDFIDVRDVVKAYWLAATRGKPGEAYNICSGKARAVQSVIDTIRMQSTAQFEIVEDKSRMKASDIPVLQGDSRKFSKLTGWKPEIGFAQTMGDLLDYWRGQV